VSKFQLPTQKGTELWPQVMRPMVMVRFRGVPPGTAVARELLNMLQGKINQFYTAQAQNYALSPMAFAGKGVDYGDLRMAYTNNFGTEIIYVQVSSAVLEEAKRLAEKERRKKSREGASIDWLALDIFVKGPRYRSQWQEPPEIGHVTVDRFPVVADASFEVWNPDTDDYASNVKVTDASPPDYTPDYFPGQLEENSIRFADWRPWWNGEGVGVWDELTPPLAYDTALFDHGDAVFELHPETYPDGYPSPTPWVVGTYMKVPPERVYPDDEEEYDPPEPEPVTFRIGGMSNIQQYTAPDDAEDVTAWKIKFRLRKYSISIGEEFEEIDADEPWPPRDDEYPKGDELRTFVQPHAAADGDVTFWNGPPANAADFYTQYAWVRRRDSISDPWVETEELEEPGQVPCYAVGSQWGLAPDGVTEMASMDNSGMGVSLHETEWLDYTMPCVMVDDSFGVWPGKNMMTQLAEITYDPTQERPEDQVTFTKL